MSDNEAQDKLNSLTDLQFLFVTGKGGVGKSTAAAMLGLHAANRGKNTLVVVPQTSHNPPSLFGLELSTSPKELDAGLSAVRISPDGAMREYCRQVLHSQTLTNALFHPRVAGGFLGGIPGLSDWALLGKSWAWTQSGTFQLPKDQRQYDLVIFDAPASGDGTKMLKVPQVIMELSPQGRLRDDAATCLDMLRDSQRSAVVVIGLAEDFAITETEENLHYLENELGLPLGPLIINRILKQRLTEFDLTELEKARKQLTFDRPSGEPDLALATLDAGLRYIKRYRRQKQQLGRLAHRPQGIIEVPEITYDLANLPALRRLLSEIPMGENEAGAKLG